MSMSRDLRAKVCSAVSDDLTVVVPVEKILPQLARGVIKIPYGDVRRAASHVFAHGTDYDNLPVVLPLADVLPRINPASLARRSGQKQIEEISNDVRSPFAAGGHGLTISAEKPKPTPTPSTQFTKRTSSVTAPVMPRTVIPAQPAAKTQRISTVPAPTLSPARGTESPVAVPLPESLRLSEPEAAPVFTRVVPRPQTVAPATLPISSIVPAAHTPAPAIESTTPVIPMPVIPMISAAPVVPVAPAAPAAPAAPPFTIALSTLVERWPETMQQEIVKLNLTGAQVELPSHLVEEGLKRGRVTFAWKTLRTWIRPTPVSVPSVHDETELELPLKVLAPIFLSKQKSAGMPGHSKVAVEESIPNLFFGFPQAESVAPEPAPAAALTAAPAVAPALPPAFAPTVAPVAPSVSPVAAPASRSPETNYYVWDDNTDTAFIDQGEFKRKPAPSQSMGTDFIVRFATPNEIVSRAAALDGVAGALIALPDGLAVASKIPENLNGDTLAAFLPQLFSKMSQCIKELRMGELNNLNFTVGNIPWKIFRVNAVFFAAFGRAGQGLPTAQLAALAVELDHRNKR
jgi:predicted regulator of Ras-like GTPase activity (Roadblock/LC7/MglB family)